MLDSHRLFNSPRSPKIPCGSVDIRFQSKYLTQRARNRNRRRREHHDAVDSHGYRHRMALEPPTLRFGDDDVEDPINLTPASHVQRGAQTYVAPLFFLSQSTMRGYVAAKPYSVLASQRIDLPTATGRGENDQASSALLSIVAQLRWTHRLCSDVRPSKHPSGTELRLFSLRNLVHGSSRRKQGRPGAVMCTA